MTETEFLTTVSVPAGAGPGTLLYTAHLSPQSLLNTRLKTIASLWDQYQVKRYTMTITPSAPTTVAGSYAASIDPDPFNADELEEMTADQVQRNVSTTPGSCERSLWDRGSTTLMSPNKEWLFTDPKGGNELKTEFGSVALIVFNTTAGYTGNIDLTLRITYTFAFKGASAPKTGNTTSYPNITLTSEGGQKPHSDDNSILFLERYAQAVRPLVAVYRLLSATATGNDEVDRMLADGYLVRFVDADGASRLDIHLYTSIADAQADMAGVRVQFPEDAIMSKASYMVFKYEAGIPIDPNEIIYDPVASRSLPVMKLALQRDEELESRLRHLEMLLQRSLQLVAPSAMDSDSEESSPEMEQPAISGGSPPKTSPSAQSAVVQEMAKLFSQRPSTSTKEDSIRPSKFPT